jgi:LAS superfamily LD-carboxypeptidase LdcB
MRFFSAASIVLISLFSSCGAEPIREETVSVREFKDESAEWIHDSFDFTNIDLEGRLTVLPASATGRVDDFLDLTAQILKMPPGYLSLVDKSHPLPEDYVPARLVSLDGYGRIRTARNGLFLDRPAADALEQLSAAAEEDGVNLVTTSAYRSYAYQENLFTSYAEKDGIEAAQRYSAGAGMSQHQLGTTVDFGSITNSFAESEAGVWLTAEAENHGWEPVLPKGIRRRDRLYVGKLALAMDRCGRCGDAGIIFRRHTAAPSGILARERDNFSRGTPEITGMARLTVFGQNILPQSFLAVHHDDDARTDRNDVGE